MLDGIRRGWLLGLVVIFLASVLLVQMIQVTHMRDDEETSLRTTSRDFAYALRYQAEGDVQAPAWFLMFWGWQQFMGDSEFMSRLFAVLMSMVTLALVYRIGREWFGDPRFGIFPAAVLGVNAFFITYALEIRPYALVMLSATFSMWALGRWLRGRSWRWAVVYGVSLAVMLYAHYFLVFLIVVQGVWFVVVMMMKPLPLAPSPYTERGDKTLTPSPSAFASGREPLPKSLPVPQGFPSVIYGEGLGDAVDPLIPSPSPPNSGEKGEKTLTPSPSPSGRGEYAVGYRIRWVRQGAGAVLVGAALWLPWFPVVLGQIRNLAAAEAMGGNARGLAGIGSTTEPTSLEAVFRLFQVMSGGQVGLYALILICGLAVIGVAYGGHKRGYWLAAGWAFGAPLLVLLVNLVLAVYAQRYVAYTAVGFGMVAGVSLAYFSRRVRWLALAITLMISLWALPSQLPQRTPYRDLYRQVGAAAREGDVILFYPPRSLENFILWQIHHYLPGWLFENRVGNPETAAEHRRVWYATGDWFNPVVRDGFAALETTHPVQQVIGSCRRHEWCYLVQLMEAPPLDEPVMFGEDMPFWGVDVDTVTRDMISARLWWRVEETPRINYSLGLQVLDANGVLVGQTDGPIRHYGETVVETSAFEPGRIYMDKRTVTLPPGLPDGAYELVLVVYDSQSGERLRLADGADSLVLREEIVLSAGY